LARFNLGAHLLDLLCLLFELRSDRCFKFANLCLEVPSLLRDQAPD
jgi:hypothetical protein